MAAPPARVMVDTPAGKKSVAATSSAAKSAAPVQKTYNYHKPAEEPFRAPPVQKTFNYSKPAAAPSAAPNRAEAYRLATKAPAQAAAPKNFASTPVGSMPKNSDTLLNKAGDFFFPDAFRPLPNSRKSNFAADMASPLLENAYNLASTATTMTPDPNSYAPEVIQRLGKYVTNMGLAGLNAAAAPVYGAAGLAADVANKLGVPRPEALARDLGAMLDSAGILPEGRMLASMLPDVPAPRISRAPEELPTQTPAETLMTPAEEAFRQEVLDGGFYFDDPAGREALRNELAREAAANLPDPFYDPLPPPPNFLMDRPEGYDPFAALRPQNNREATPPAAATTPGQRTPEDIEAELDRIFGPDQGGVFDPDTEAYAALETAYDNQVPEPNEIDPFDDPALRTARYLDDVFPTILERAQRGDPLTDEEAFDVMTFERYGRDGVYDPTNTLENWGQQTNNDREAAERIAYLTGADRQAGQNPVAPVEGPYFEDPFQDVYEIDEDFPHFGYPENNVYLDDTPEPLEPDFPDGYGVPDDQPNPFDEDQFDPFEDMGDMPDPFRMPAPSKPRPLVQREEGIASMYSPTRRAVEQLRQSRFPDPVAMEKQLLAMGAKPDELESLLKRIGKSDVSEGGLKKLRLAELADEAASEVQQFRRRDPEYGSYTLRGAIDPHVTTFEAPVGTPKGVSQHFGAKKPDNTVLAHIRSAMFQTPDSNRPNVYHLSEIQSDWAQFRTKLFSSNDEYLKAEVERDRLLDYVQNLLRTGYTPDSNLEDYKKASAKLEKLQDRLGATDTYGFRTYFDEDFPAPYVKTTRKWHQLALKQALIEAVNSGADYMSLATGEQVKSYTGGKLEGQQKFYDEMTPRELDNILTKFSKETGVEKPVLEYQFIYGQDGSGHEVPAIRITDEFREAMKKYGLPSFAKGGIVTLPT